MHKTLLLCVESLLEDVVCPVFPNELMCVQPRTTQRTVIWIGVRFAEVPLRVRTIAWIEVLCSW